MVCVPSGKKPRKGCLETNFGPNPWNYPRYPLSVLQYFHFPIWIWFRRCQDAPPKPRQVQWVRKSMKSPKSRQWFAMQFSHSFLHSNLPHLQIGKRVTKMTHMKIQNETFLIDFQTLVIVRAWLVQISPIRIKCFVRQITLITKQKYFCPTFFLLFLSLKSVSRETTKDCNLIKEDSWIALQGSKID